MIAPRPAPPCSQLWKSRAGATCFSLSPPSVVAAYQRGQIKTVESAAGARELEVGGPAHTRQALLLMRAGQVQRGLYVLMK